MDHKIVNYINLSAELKCLYFLHLYEFGLMIEIQHLHCAKAENVNTHGVREGGLKGQTFKGRYQAKLEFQMCIERRGVPRGGGGVQTKTFPIRKV